MTTAVLGLTRDTFDETIKGSDLPVVIEFWAAWCPSCKTIAPALEAIATEQVQRVRIFKVNVDEHPELAARYEVMSIPTVLVFKGGDLVGRMVGARGRSRLLEEIDTLIR
jgi:thioredoxin 1